MAGQVTSNAGQPDVETHQLLWQLLKTTQSEKDRVDHLLRHQSENQEVQTTELQSIRALLEAAPTIEERQAEARAENDARQRCPLKEGNVHYNALIRPLPTDSNVLPDLLYCKRAKDVAEEFREQYHETGLTDAEVEELMDAYGLTLQLRAWDNRILLCKFLGVRQDRPFID